MARWLFKSEPETYSIDDLARDRTTFWDGVRNYQARNLLRATAVGDGVLFYHSNAAPPAVVGIARVAKPASPDPSEFDQKSDHFDPDSPTAAPRWWGVTLRFEAKLRRGVGLPELRETHALAKMVLLNRSRLSVQPVTDGEWNAILDLAQR